MTELGLLAKKQRGRKRQAIQSLQGYVARRTDTLKYLRYLAEGFQIGSGPTDAQYAYLTTRLKG